MMLASRFRFWTAAASVATITAFAPPALADCGSNCSAQCDYLGSGPDWAQCMNACLDECLANDPPAVPDVPPPAPVEEPPATPDQQAAPVEEPPSTPDEPAAPVEEPPATPDDPSSDPVDESLGAKSVTVAAPAAEEAAPVLPGTAWKFIQVFTAAIPDSVGATIEFGKSGNASGKSGCNSFTGGYTVNASDLAFAELGYTKMMCPPDRMAVESEIQTVLKRTRHVAAKDGELEFLASDGTLLARLVSVPVRPKG